MNADISQRIGERIAVVVLAAGKGTRMRSRLPKVMHAIAGRPMIAQVVETAAALEPAMGVVVVGPDMEVVGAAAAPFDIVLQPTQRGTGDAVICARDQLDGFAGDVLVVYGDTPLITADTLAALVAARRGNGGHALAVLGFRPADPAEYGRLVTTDDGALEAIVEYKDADAETRALGLCNAGAMAIDGSLLFSLLDQLDDNNAKGELYLTDLVKLARAAGRRCTVAEADPVEVAGINTRAQLAEAEAAMQIRLRRRAMQNGVTLVDPTTVWLAYDTQLGTDVIVGPHVFFGPGVSIGDDVEILPFCHLEQARVAARARIGPYARLRPGANIGDGARIGNFVEVKAATVEPGAKVNHLTYIGDARVGAHANVGAGTITCNYDGFRKSHTDIGVGAFIGSNSALIAPVAVGDGAIVGAGSVITHDVPKDGLSIARGDQSNIAGGAERWRSRRRKSD